MLPIIEPLRKGVGRREGRTEDLQGSEALLQDAATVDT